METKVEKKISELERKTISLRASLPHNFENKVEVTDGSVTAIYIGSLYFVKPKKVEDRIYVSGGISLSRYELIPYTRTTKRLVRIFPPEYERKTTPMLREKHLWETFEYFSPSNYSQLYTNGVPNEKCRAAIKEKTERKHKVIVSDELMEMVFGPLDKQIADWYQKVTEPQRVK